MSDPALPFPADFSGCLTAANQYAPSLAGIAGASWTREYEAGVSNRNGDITQALEGMLLNVGRYGAFDYQRMGGTFNRKYVDASNFGVGVYMNGAGYSISQMDYYATAYAKLTHDTNIANDLSEWKNGWYWAQKYCQI